MATVTLSTGTNFIRYPSGGGYDNTGGSHVVGYESSRYRVERYSFVAPTQTDNKINISEITHVEMIFPTDYYTVGGGNPNNFKFLISTNAEAWKDLNVSQGTGNVTVTDKQPSIGKTPIKLTPGTTYYLFIYQSNSTYGWRYWGSGGAPTLTTTDVTYSKCGAPTSITASSFTIPEKKVTINWSGATAGTSNSITGYTIYIKAGAAPSSNDYTYMKKISSTAGNGSAEIDIKSDDTHTVARGTTYYIKMVTDGSAGKGWESGISTVSASTKINSLPSQPNVTAPRLFHSKGSTVTFSATAGADADGSAQTLELYYGTSQKGEKTKFTREFSVFLQANKEQYVYYFWTYDGYEFSEPASATVTKNVAPTFSFVETGGTSFLALNNDGISNNRLGWRNQIIGTFTANTSGKVVQTIHYTLDNADFLKEGEFLSSATREYIMTTTSLNYSCLVESEIREAYDSTKNLNYYITYVFYDSIESSQRIRVPETGYYSIPRAPEQFEIYNQYSNSNISGTIEGNFDKNIRIVAPWDYSCNASLTKAWVKKGDVNITSGISVSNLSVDEGQALIDINISNTLIGPGDVIDLFVEYNNIYISKKFSTQLKRCLTPNLTNEAFRPVLSSPQIYPFQLIEDSIQILEIRSAWFFGGDQTWESIYENYELSSSLEEVYSKFRIIFTNPTNSQSKEFIGGTEDFTLTRQGDDLVGQIPLSKIFNFYKENEYEQNDYGITSNDYAGVYNLQVKWQLTNLYGAIYNSNITNFSLNFNSFPKTFLINAFRVTDTNGIVATIGSEDGNINFLQENMTPSLTCQLDLFTNEEINLVLQLNKNNGTGWADYASIAFNRGELIYGSGDGPGENTIEWRLDNTIEEIVENTESYQWRLKVQCAAGVIYRDTEENGGNIFETPIIQHTLASLILNSVQLDEQENYLAYYDLSSYGYQNQNSEAEPIYEILYQLQLVQSTDQGLEPASEEIHNQDIDLQAYTHLKFEDSEPGWDFKILGLKFTSSITQRNAAGFSNTVIKETITNLVNIYNASPTMAYRRNCIGINTKEPMAEEDLNHNKTGVFVIKSTTNRNKIILKSANKTATIDLESGEMEGFVFDCGTWDSDS